MEAASGQEVLPHALRTKQEVSKMVLSRVPLKLFSDIGVQHFGSRDGLFDCVSCERSFLKKDLWLADML